MARLRAGPLVAACALLPAWALAQGPGGPGKGPPPPAYDACAGRSEEDACSFRTPHGSESGVCADFGGELACLPEGAPRPPGARRGASPERRGRAGPMEEQPAREEPPPRRRETEEESFIDIRVLDKPRVEFKPMSLRAQPPALAAPAPAAAVPAPAAAVPPPAPAQAAAPPAAAAEPSIPLGAALGGLGALAGLLALWRASAAARHGAAPAAPDTGTAPYAPTAGTAVLPGASPNTLKTLSPGSLPLIGGTYKATKEIGAGGMGVVYEAVDLKLDRRVAMKRLRPEISASPRGRERFLTEARTVAKLSHPNIVAIHAIIEEGPDLFIVFEYVDGETLDQMLSRQHRLEARAALGIFVGVADAVDYAHSQRVIHRDLKPSNIMVDRQGRPKVMDFGIAHQARVTISQVTTAEAAGTYPYMPPEQALGHAVRESDVYAFAAVTYEALTGDLPFPGPDFQLQKSAMSFRRPSQMVAGMTGAVDAVFERALQTEPKRRYATTSEFVRTLQGAVPA